MTRAAIVAAARGWIGTPYRHGASLEDVGCDCLGLVRGVWRQVIGPEPEPVPPYARDWAEAGRREWLFEGALRHLVRLDLDEAQAGDVLLFRWRDRLPAAHCAILASPAIMIHAHAGAAVAEVAVAPFWSRHRAGAFAFPGLDPTEIAP